MITAELVKNLREKTGAGMMDCKKVLTETDGDIDRAIELLRERGIAKAAKKLDRIAAEGIVASYLSDDKKVGVIVEVNSETDFVAKNEEFRQFAFDLSKHIAVNNPITVEELLEQKFIVDNSKKVSEILTTKIANIGENITIRRFERYETTGVVQTYIHGDGKIGVLVNLEVNDISEEIDGLAKDVAMQVAAAKPEYLNRDAVPSENLQKEMEILKQQAINEGKPAEIAEKMVQGRIVKFYSEVCLLEQPFVKDSDITIEKLVSGKGAKVIAFSRFEKGEGIEKRQENFAEEVMKQINN